MKSLKKRIKKFRQALWSEISKLLVLDLNSNNLIVEVNLVILTTMPVSNNFSKINFDTLFSV